MLQLTTAISVPNITRMRVRKPQLDDAANELRCALEVGGAGGRIYTSHNLVVRNGACMGVRATAAPVRFDDLVEMFEVTLATGFDDAMGSLVGPSLPARLRGLESWLISVGLLPAGTVS